MEILPPSFVLRNNTKNVTPNTNLQTAPNFKANKADIGKELGEYVLKNLHSSSIKETFNHPQKRETFLQTLGSIIVATAATLTNILTNSEEAEIPLEETPDAPIESLKTVVEDKKEKTTAKKSNIEFKTVRGKKTQIESDYINFVNENFADNTTISDKLKLLFNEYCGVNRNNKHTLNNEVVENKTLIQTIFSEIKENTNDIEKLNNITAQYLALTPVTNTLELASHETPDEEKPATTKIEISETEEKEQFEQKLGNIKALFNDSSIDVSPKTITKAVSVLKKQFPDDLENVEKLFEILPTSKNKKTFIIDLANKMISIEAVKEFLDCKFNNKMDFRLYNELKKAGIKDENIKKIAEYLMLQYAKEIEVINDENDFNVKITDDYSINNKFKKIMNLFSLIKSQDITLTSNDKEKLSGEDIIGELKKDYYRNNYVTYKNLVSYLYGNKHRINNECDFDKNIYDYRLKYLLNVINNEKVFNSSLFSNHSKLRFIERFVLNENFGTKKFENATKEKVRMFIETLKKELSNGITVNSYYADDDLEKVGAQIRFQETENENIIITLNSQGKMHTII